MTVVLFILVLVVLIVVHEFGHFLVAKWSGMRVDEFGLGYPPRAWGFKSGETEYTLNWLPFGGFVRIYGEDEQDRVEGADTARSFGSRPRILQALVLIAGITMNILFAWVLLSATLAIGTERALDSSEIARAKSVALIVADVLPDSPAARAGLMPGDEIRQVTRLDGYTFAGASADGFTSFIEGDAADAPLTLTVERAGKELTLTAAPRTGVVMAHPERHALGVAVASAGIVPVAWWKAPWEGAQLTWELTKETAIALANFFGGIITGHANLSEVSGPVGIAGAVGAASRQGLSALLSLMAVISINLALINLIPVPALDGGRLLFVIIEAVIRRPLPAAATRAVNTVGFALLILLMVVVTAHDVFKIIG